MQQRFGPEYEREVRARGSERDADQHLSEVADRRDQFVTNVMRDRGYPVEDFDERAELLAAEGADSGHRGPGGEHEAD